MPLFRMTATAQATIRETWEIVAETPERALEILYNQTIDLGEGERLNHIRDTTIGDEEDRDCTEIVQVAEDFRETELNVEQVHVNLYEPEGVA